MNKDDVESLAARAKEYSKSTRDPELARILDELSLMLIQLHMSLVNEAYRNQGMQPWMRSGNET